MVKCEELVVSMVKQVYLLKDTQLNGVDNLCVNCVLSRTNLLPPKII